MKFLEKFDAFDVFPVVFALALLVSGLMLAFDKDVTGKFVEKEGNPTVLAKYLGGSMAVVGGLMFLNLLLKGMMARKK